MAKSKYAKYICTELKKEIQLPGYRGFEKNMIGQDKVQGRRRPMEHVVWTDAEVMPGGYYSECVWLWSANMPNVMPRPAMTPEQMKNFQGVPPHAHPFPELLSFFGTDMEHPEALFGEVEFWLEDEKFILDKSFVVFIPGGMTHCPLKVLRQEKPFFHFTIGPGEMYV